MGPLRRAEDGIFTSRAADVLRGETQTMFNFDADRFIKIQTGAIALAAEIDAAELPFPAVQRRSPVSHLIAIL